MRGLTSIRKGLGKNHITFLVGTNSIIASENKSGGYRLKIKEVTEKLILQNRRGPNQEGSKFFLIRRGPNPEGSCFHKTGGVLIRRGLNFADPEGSYFCQSGGVLFFVNPKGYYFLKGLRQIEEKIIVRGIRLFRDRLGISGNLP